MKSESLKAGAPLNFTTSFSRYSKLVLIVDSSQYSAQLTSKLLRGWGFSTEVCHSPSAALSMLVSGETFPDLIFVEVLNCDEDIYKFPKSVHENPLWASLPLIAHSVHAKKNDVLRAIKNGYCDYIIRPTEPDVLKEKIEKAVSQSARVNSSTFSVPLSAQASLTQNLEITAISEFGIEVMSGHPFTVNRVIGLNSDCLVQFGLDHGLFRVVGCKEERGLDGLKYRIGMTFVGLKPQSAKLIRQYLIRESRRLLTPA